MSGSSFPTWERSLNKDPSDGSVTPTTHSPTLERGDATHAVRHRANFEALTDPVQPLTRR